MPRVTCIIALDYLKKFNANPFKNSSINQGVLKKFLQIFSRISKQFSKKKFSQVKTLRIVRKIV